MDNTPFDRMGDSKISVTITAAVNDLRKEMQYELRQMRTEMTSKIDALSVSLDNRDNLCPFREDLLTLKARQAELERDIAEMKLELSNHMKTSAISANENTAAHHRLEIQILRAATIGGAAGGGAAAIATFLAKMLGWI
jgi:hypothetical protein